MIALNIRAHQLPRSPRLMRTTSIEILMGRAVSAADDMQNALRCLWRILKVHRDDIQTCQRIELSQVVEKGIVDYIGGYIALQERTFQFVEQLGLVITKLWLQPIFPETRRAFDWPPKLDSASSIAGVRAVASMISSSTRLESRP